MTRILIAGVGNLFLGDDGFGCEVARRAALRELPPGVVARDFGARVLDLMFELERSERAIVVDVLRRGGRAGALYVLDPIAGGGGELAAPHAATGTAGIGWAAARRDRGLWPRSLRLVGCEPAWFGDEDEGGAIGLSAPVAAAVDAAVDRAVELARGFERGEGCTSSV